jgi:hypothetical protein
MRYTFLTLLTFVLIAPMGCKNKHDSSDEQSTQTSNTDQQSGVTLPSSQKDEILEVGRICGQIPLTKKPHGGFFCMNLCLYK